MKELDRIKGLYVKRQRGPDGRRRIIGAMESPDEVLACYRRIQGYFQRLTVGVLPPLLCLSDL